MHLALKNIPNDVACRSDMGALGIGYMSAWLWVWAVDPRPQHRVAVASSGAEPRGTDLTSQQRKASMYGFGLLKKNIESKAESRRSKIKEEQSIVNAVPFRNA